MVLLPWILCFQSDLSQHHTHQRTSVWKNLKMSQVKIGQKGNSFDGVADIVSVKNDAMGIVSWCLSETPHDVFAMGITTSFPLSLVATLSYLWIKSWSYLLPYPTLPGMLERGEEVLLATRLKHYWLLWFTLHWRSNIFTKFKEYDIAAIFTALVSTVTWSIFISTGTIVA